jgi:mRNA interferase RelE/StbE
LNVEPIPTDRQKLKGYLDLYRALGGEYRLVYRFSPKQDLVEVILVDKRNDGEVYKRLQQLMGS